MNIVLRCLGRSWDTGKHFCPGRQLEVMGNDVLFQGAWREKHVAVDAQRQVPDMLTRIRPPSQGHPIFLLILFILW